MKCEVENLESTKVKLTVTVPYDEFKPAMDKAYKEVSGQVNVPGFRKGHVPAQVIDQRVGRVYVIEQAVNSALPGFYRDAVAQSKRMPLAQPEVDVTEIPNVEGAAGGQLVFTATVEVAPEFELPNLEDVTVQVDPVEVSVDDVEEELDKLRLRFATLKTVKRAAKNGDFCSIDLKAVVDGEEVDSASGVSYEVGSDRMLDGTDQALKGMKADQEKTFKTTLAGGPHAGEEAEVTVKVRSVKERELPEADDDFAQMVSDKDTIGELRVELREQVEKNKAGQQAVQARDKVLDYLRENVQIDLPQGIVDAEVEHRTDEKATKEQIADTKKMVEDQLRDQILLDRLVDEQEVQVSEAEVLDYVIQMSQAYGIDPSTMLSGGREQLAGMMGEVARTKALVACLRQVSVKDSAGKDIDLSEFTKDPAASEE